MPPLNIVLPADRALWRPEVHAQYSIEALYDELFMLDKVKRVDREFLQKNEVLIIHDLSARGQVNAIGSDGGVKLQKLPANVAQITITEQNEYSYGISDLTPIVDLENDQAMHAKDAGVAHAEAMERFAIALQSGVTQRHTTSDIADTDMGLVKLDLDKAKVRSPRKRYGYVSLEQQAHLILQDWAANVEWQGMGYKGEAIKEGTLSPRLFGFTMMYGDLLNPDAVAGTGHAHMFWTDEAIAFAVQKKLAVKGPIPSEGTISNIYQTWSKFGGGLIRPAFMSVLDGSNL
jgi:hypothetical protein